MFADATIIQIDAATLLGAAGIISAGIGGAVTFIAKVVVKYLSERDTQQTNLGAQVLRVVDEQRQDRQGMTTALLEIQKGTIEVLGNMKVEIHETNGLVRANGELWRTKGDQMIVSDRQTVERLDTITKNIDELKQTSRQKRVATT